jgi:adenine-specific DNA methylase
MPVPDNVLSLIDRFERNRDDYRSPNYNEARLRLEFLDPFFEALGWDVQNKQGNAEAYKDVISEDSLRVEDTAKAPDYCFRIGGQRKFFVEAKKPAVNIHDDISPAYQLRRYAWSAKLPLSILSDFEEFAVYDTRIKPNKNDSASTARVKFIKCTEYPDRWDEIAEIFSRDSILKGFFDKFADGTKKKRGTALVDDAILEEIESWRDMLARNIALRNPGLTQRDLNFSVQSTIDRIIFLRICEGRGIEPYGSLMALQNGANVYRRLWGIFRDADVRYNSGLFHFTKEENRPNPDSLTPKLVIDDRVLKDILKCLYYPDSPYEFAMIPADILGQVYERFLGKVIRLTPGGQAKVEEKPEVRKAGGVYYTPTYIVDYIVKNTIGKLLENHGLRHERKRVLSPDPSHERKRVLSPDPSHERKRVLLPDPSHERKRVLPPNQSRERERVLLPKLRILDPACGSGSFLLVAYQHLLDWYLAAYTQNDPATLSKKRKAPVFMDSHGDWRLTPSERKRILLDHIYGVDIDSQAVEVTKLSLLLKVLEGENEEAIKNQLVLLHERALPDLDSNIKCGNSLIGPDFYANAQMMLLTEDEQYRINVFDWKKEFPDVFKGDNPGFDAVIGNPPYVRIQGLKEWAPKEVEFYKENYKAGSKGNFDIYVLFVEQGLKLLNKEGRLGFILPHKFFNAKYGEPLRSLIAEGRHLLGVVHFGHEQVFAGATTYTCLLFLSKPPVSSCNISHVSDLQSWISGKRSSGTLVPSSNITATDWNLNDSVESDILQRLDTKWPRLGTFTSRIAQGVRTSANEVYVLDVLKTTGKQVIVRSRQLAEELTIEKGVVLPFLLGREIRAYHVEPSMKVLLFPYRINSGVPTIIPEQELARDFPLAWEYLKANKSYLQAREKGRFKGPLWYQFGRQQNIDVMMLPKILVPDIAHDASFALDLHGEYAFTSGYGITLKNECALSPSYLLGLLNSPLLDFYLKKVSTALRGGFFRYFTQFVEQLPIRPIDFSNPSDRKRHDRMVDLVDHMLDLHKKLQTIKTPHEKDTIQRQIDATDRQIDLLVYELYELTEEEIGIVEGEN